MVLPYLQSDPNQLDWVCEQRGNKELSIREGTLKTSLWDNCKQHWQVIKPDSYLMFNSFTMVEPLGSTADLCWYETTASQAALWNEQASPCLFIIQWPATYGKPSPAPWNFQRPFQRSRTYRGERAEAGQIREKGRVGLVGEADHPPLTSQRFLEKKNTTIQNSLSSPQSSLI